MATNMLTNVRRTRCPAQYPAHCSWRSLMDLKAGAAPTAAQGDNPQLWSPRGATSVWRLGTSQSLAQYYQSGRARNYEHSYGHWTGCGGNTGNALSVGGESRATSPARGSFAQTVAPRLESLHAGCGKIATIRLGLTSSDRTKDVNGELKIVEREYDFTIPRPTRKRT